jgi:hypothetical protein
VSRRAQVWADEVDGVITTAASGYGCGLTIDTGRLRRCARRGGAAAEFLEGEEGEDE